MSEKLALASLFFCFLCLDSCSEDSSSVETTTTSESESESEEDSSSGSSSLFLLSEVVDFDEGDFVVEEGDLVVDFAVDFDLGVAFLVVTAMVQTLDRRQKALKALKAFKQERMTAEDDGYWANEGKGHAFIDGHDAETFISPESCDLKSKQGGNLGGHDAQCTITPGECAFRGI